MGKNGEKAGFMHSLGIILAVAGYLVENGMGRWKMGTG